MATIKEDYVSFEVAKLLKEKGFDEYCPESYFKMDKTLKESGFSEWEKVNEIKAPTQSLAMKWLREVHHLYIQVMLDSWACGGHMGYYIVIQNTTSDFKIMLQDFVDDVFYDTYEDACEAAIKYCLENFI